MIVGNKLKPVELIYERCELPSDSRSALLGYDDRGRVCQGLIGRLDLLALLELDQLLLDALLLRGGGRGRVGVRGRVG